EPELGGLREAAVRVAEARPRTALQGDSAGDMCPGPDDRLEGVRTDEATGQSGRGHDFRLAVPLPRSAVRAAVQRLALHEGGTRCGRLYRLPKQAVLTHYLPVSRPEPSATASPSPSPSGTRRRRFASVNARSTGAM